MAWITDARAEEQQRLEEGVGEQVEHRRAIGADAGGEEHVAELRAGRISDHALDVGLHQADRRGEDGGGGADVGDDRQRGRRDFEHRRQAADHEHAGGDHGRGVDQRARPGSGLPSRRAARCAGRAAPTCPSRRRTAAGRARSSCRRVMPAKPMVEPAIAGRGARIAGIETVPNTRKVPKMPSEKPKSPTRLTTNAFIAAALALGL